MADAASPVTTLNYVKASTATTAFLGLPRLCQSPSLSVRQMKALVGIGAATESHPVTLHDARSDSSLRYETCGFKLEPLSSGVVDWSQVAKRGTPEHTLYKAELEAIVRRLHPDAKALAWSTFLLRGGPGENGPAAGAIHLDWYPDVAACKEFLSEHPEGYHDLKDTAAQVKSQPGNENLELKVVLGLWKPRNESNPVKEAPLIVRAHVAPRTAHCQNMRPRRAYSHSAVARCKRAARMIW